MTTYLAGREKVFGDPAPKVVDGPKKKTLPRKRSHARLKAYTSTQDVRAWSSCRKEKQLHFMDLFRTYKAGWGNYIPVPALVKYQGLGSSQQTLVEILQNIKNALDERNQEDYVPLTESEEELKKLYYGDTMDNDSSKDDEIRNLRNLVSELTIQREIFEASRCKGDCEITKNVKIKELECRLQRVIRENSAFQKQLAAFLEIEANMNRVMENYDAIEKELKFLKVDHEKSKAEAAKGKRDSEELQAAKKLLEEYEKECFKHRQQLAECELITDERDMLRNEVQQQKLTITDQDEEIERLLGQILHLSESADYRQEKMRVMFNELREELKHRQQELIDAKEELLEKETVIDELEYIRCQMNVNIMELTDNKEFCQDAANQVNTLDLKARCRDELECLQQLQELEEQLAGLAKKDTEVCKFSQGTLAVLQEGFQKFVSEHEEFRLRIEELEKELEEKDSLKEQLDICMQELESFAKMYADAKNNLRSELSISDSLKSKLRVLDQYSEYIKELEDKLKTTQDELCECQNDLKQCTLDKKIAQRKADDCEAFKSELQAMVDACTGDQMISDESECTLERKKELLGALDDCLERLRELQDANDKLENDLHESQKYIQGLETELHDLERLRDEIDAARAQAANQVDVCQNIILEKVCLIDSLSTEKQALQKEVQGLAEKDRQLMEETGETDKQYGEVLDQVKVLAGELDGSKKALFETEKSNKDLELHYTCLRKKIEESSEEISELSSIIIQLESELDLEREQHAATKSKAGALQASVQQIGDQTKELQHLLDSCKESLEKQIKLSNMYKARVEEIDAAFKKCTEQNIELQHQITDLQSNLNGERKNNDSLRSQIKMLEGDVELLKSEKTACKDEVSRLEQVIDDLNSSLDMCKHECGRYRNKIEALQSNNHALRYRMADQAIELEDKDSIIQRLTQSTKTLQNRLDVLENDGNISRTDSLQLEAEINRLRADILKVQGDLDNANLLNDGLKKSLYDCQCELQNVTREYNKLKGALGYMQDQYCQMQSELNRCKEEKEKLLQEIITLEKAAEQSYSIISGLEALLAQDEDVNKELKDEIDILKGKFRNVELEKEKLEKSMEQSREQFDVMKRDLEALNLEHGGLLSTLQNTEKESKDLYEENLSLKARVSELENELEDCLANKEMCEDNYVKLQMDYDEKKCLLLACERKLQNSEEQFTALRNKYKVCKEENGVMMLEIGDQAMKIKDLESAVRALREDLKALTTAMNAGDARFQHLLKELCEYQKVALNQEIQSIESEESSGHLESEINNLTSMISALESEKEGLERKFLALFNENLKLIDEKVELGNQLSECQENLKVVTEDNECNKKQIAAYLRDIDGLQASITALEEQIVNLNETIAAQNEEVAAARYALKEAEKLSEKLQGELVDCGNQIENLNKDIALRDDLLGDMEGKLEAAIQEAMEIKSETKEKSIVLEAELIGSKMSQSGLEDELKSERNRTAELEEFTNKLTNKIDDLEQQLKSQGCQLDECNYDLEKALALIDDLKAQIAGLETLKTSLTNQLSNCNIDVLNLKDTIVDLEEEIDGLTCQVSGLESQNEGLKKELEKAKDEIHCAWCEESKSRTAYEECACKLEAACEEVRRLELELEDCLCKIQDLGSYVSMVETLSQNDQILSETTYLSETANEDDQLEDLFDGSDMITEETLTISDQYSHLLEEGKASLTQFIDYKEAAEESAHLMEQQIKLCECDLVAERVKNGNLERDIDICNNVVGELEALVGDLETELKNLEDDNTANIKKIHDMTVELEELTHDFNNLFDAKECWKRKAKNRKCALVYLRVEKCQAEEKLVKKEADFAQEDVLETLSTAANDNEAKCLAALNAIKVLRAEFKSLEEKYNLCENGRMFDEQTLKTLKDEILDHQRTIQKTTANLEAALEKNKMYEEEIETLNGHIKCFKDNTGKDANEKCLLRDEINRLRNVISNLQNKITELKDESQGKDLLIKAENEKQTDYDCKIYQLSQVIEEYQKVNLNLNYQVCTVEQENEYLKQQLCAVQQEIESIRAMEPPDTIINRVLRKIMNCGWEMATLDELSLVHQCLCLATDKLVDACVKCRGQKCNCPLEGTLTPCQVRDLQIKFKVLDTQLSLKQMEAKKKLNNIQQAMGDDTKIQKEVTIREDSAKGLQTTKDVEREEIPDAPATTGKSKLKFASRKKKEKSSQNVIASSDDSSKRSTGLAYDLKIAKESEKKAIAAYEEEKARRECLEAILCPPPPQPAPCHEAEAVGDKRLSTQESTPKVVSEIVSPDPSQMYAKIPPVKVPLEKCGTGQRKTCPCTNLVCSHREQSRPARSSAVLKKKKSGQP